MIKNLNVTCRDLHSPLIRPLELHTLQAQTFLVPQMHESPSNALKAFITSPSPGKWDASASHLPQPYTWNSPGNFLSLSRKHDLQNYTSGSAKALHGTSDFSSEGLMTHKCASTVSFTIWFYFNPSLDKIYISSRKDFSACAYLPLYILI